MAKSFQIILRYLLFLTMIVLSQSCINELKLNIKPLTTEGNGSTTTPLPEHIVVSPSSQAAMNITGGVSPSAVFDFIVVNTGGVASQPLSVTLSNTTNFEFTTIGCVGVVLAPNDTCTIKVRSKAVASGALTGNLLVESTTIKTIPLSGTASGFAENISVSPTSQTGMDLTSGVTPGSVYDFVVTNNGTVSSQALSVTLSNTTNFEFTTAGCQGVVLVSGATCTIKVRSKSGANGALTGNLLVTSLSTNTIALSGTASGFAESIAISPTSQSGMNITAGTSPGSVIDFVATNSGTISSQALTTSLSNTTNFEFTVDGCSGVVLAPGGTCTMKVRPKATTNGSLTGNLQVQSVGTTTVALSGTASGFIVPFITTWKTTTASESITLPLVNGSNYNFVVQWGDGTQSTITAWNDAAAVHTYAAAGTYTVTMLGTFESLSFGLVGTSRSKILDVTQWGSNAWIGTDKMFMGCDHLNMTATDAPNLSQATNMNAMFASAAIFNGNIGHWDVSTITDMGFMFQYASAFNKDLSNWDISNVIRIGAMFNGAVSFNQNIGNWDTSSVQFMNNAFQQATAFNQDISSWDTSNVTNMSGMFASADAFNKDISSWDTSHVTNMSYMFAAAIAFNKPVNAWVTSAVTNMAGMFNGATAFNQPVNSWNVSNVTNMSNLFSNTSAFNQNLPWTTTSATNMTYMFYNATAFNGTFGAGWNTANITDMTSMFESATVFNQSIGTWNTSNVTNMNGTFRSASAFNQNIGSWNTANVTDMSLMFYNAGVFNQNLSWNTGNVTNMSNMFQGAGVFNGTLGGAWNTAKVTNMNSMFRGAFAFNQSLAGWDVTKVTNMDYMFFQASAFNQNIGGWNPTLVTSMNVIFGFASAFNQDLSSWDVDQVTAHSSYDMGATAWVLPKPNFI